MPEPEEEPRPPPKRKRGFGGMTPEKQRAIAQKGGKAAHAKGVAHEFTPEEAQAAGKKGGANVAKDKEHMARIGRKGGKASHQPKAEAQVQPTMPKAQDEEE
jgi:general stress protein YciG